MKQAYIDRGWSLRYPKAGETFNGIPVITADSLTSAAPYITTTTASNVTTTTSGSSSNSISSSSSGNQFWNITNNDDKIAANSNSVTSSGYSGMHRHSPVDLNVIDDDLNGDIVMAFAKDDEPVPDIHNIDIIVSPPPKDKDTDFGAESGSLSRWTQKALIKKPPQKFLNSQCMLEISKLN